MDENKKDEMQEAVNEEESMDAVEESAEEENGKGKKEKKKKKKEIDLLKEEIISLKEELATSKNAYYKAYADTENLKKRLQNDADTVRKYRIQGFLSDILPAIDNLERSLLVEATSEEMKNYMDGIKMIYQQIMTALTHEGVSVIEAKEKPFDPKLHQALIQEKAEGVESGMVLEEIQKGYLLKDRVVRASLVKVSE